MELLNIIVIKIVSDIQVVFFLSFNIAIFIYYDIRMSF
jgi:hypothetical protein